MWPVRAARHFRADWGTFDGGVDGGVFATGATVDTTHHTPHTGSLQVSAEAAAQPADPGHGHGSADGSDGDNDTVDVRGLPIRCFRSLNAAKGEKGILDLA